MPEDNYGAPLVIVASLKRYVEHKVPTGSFLQAVLENNLKEAFERADDINRYKMFEIFSYCYNKIPAISWGSPERVKNWLKS